MKKQIENLGFVKNTKIVNGFKPHYKRGNDFLFIIGADYYPSKIYRIDTAFKTHTGKVYGVLTERSPRVSVKDWITARNLTLLDLNDFSVGRWKEDGTDVEFVKNV